MVRPINPPVPTDAVSRFGLNGSQWLRPKPKTFFYAEFEFTNQNSLNQETLTRMPLMVRTVDRPQFDLETSVQNQYNKARVIHSKIKYQPVRVIYYDDVDNTALKVFNEYRKFYYGDFQEKTFSSWRYDTVGPGFETSSDNWGMSVQANGNGENSYFFKRLNIFEFYNDQFTVFNLIHPKITSFEMDPRDISAEAISETTISIEYEGVTHEYDGIGEGVDLINYPITPAIAEKIRIPYNGAVSDRTSPPPKYTVRSAERDIRDIKTIFDSRNPGQTATQTVLNRSLPPQHRNMQLPNTWDQAVSQATVLSGTKNAGTINRITRLAKSIFG